MLCYLFFVKKIFFFHIYFSNKRKLNITSNIYDVFCFYFYTHFGLADIINVTFFCNSKGKHHYFVVSSFFLFKKKMILMLFLLLIFPPFRHHFASIIIIMPP